MKKIIMILFAFGTLAIYSQTPTSKGEVSTDQMSFAWVIEGDTLQGTLRGKTTGWVAVGFDPTNKMKDANIIIGYVNGDQVVIEDHFGHSPIGHKLDTAFSGGTNDVKVLGGSEKDGWTEIRFAVPINSKDKYDTPLQKGKHILIFAHGPKDNVTSKHKYDARKEMIIE